MEGNEQENKNENPQTQENQQQNNNPENVNQPEEQKKSDEQEQENNNDKPQTNNEEQDNQQPTNGEEMNFMNKVFGNPNNNQKRPQQMAYPRYPNRQYQNMAQNYENNRGFSPQSLQDGQNNFYVNTQPQPNRQNFDNNNNYKFDKTGSNIYDIQRSLMNFKEPDNKILETVIGNVDQDIEQDKDLKKLKAEVDKKIGELKPIKQWYKGYKNNFLNIVGELAKKIDKDGKLDVSDLKDWKEKTLKTLQESIKNTIKDNNNLNGSLKNFLTRTSIELDSINGTFKEPFDSDKIQLELTELTEEIIKRQENLNNDIIDKLLTILIDFFTLRRTYQDLKEGNEIIDDIREDIEELLKAKNFKDHELTFARIKKRLSSLKTILKRQNIGFEKYDKVVKTFKTKRIDKVDGIAIVAELVKNLGRESVVGFYKDLSVDNQKRIHKKIYDYISKETLLTGNKDNETIVTEILTNDKQKDVNKKIEKLNLNERQKKITKKLCEGAMRDERKAIEDEFEDNTKKFEAIQNGILELNDINENKELTSRIGIAIDRIYTYYKNKIESAINNINNVSTTGMPIGYTQSDLLQHYLSSCESDIKSLLKRYKDKYGYPNNEKDMQQEIYQSEEEFKEKNKRYEEIKNTFFSKEKDKETGEEKLILKTGKENDSEIFTMILERENLKKLKFKNWENIRDKMNENIEILKNTITQATIKLNNALPQKSPKSIMDNEFNRDRIINNCYQELMDKKYINTSGQGKGGDFGGFRN